MAYQRFLRPDEAGGVLPLGIVGATPSGLVHGAAMAYLGHHVVLFAEDPTLLHEIRSGRLPFCEAGLKDLVKRGIQQGTLELTDDLEQAVANKDMVFLCSDTPALPNGSTLVQPLVDAARAIAPHLTGHTLVVVRSQVPAGTCEQVAAWIREGLQREATIGIAMNPDFVRRGEALQNALNPDRIVVGADNDDDAMPLFELYAPFECPIVLSSLRSAELSKYAANAFLATKISFINGMAMLCEQVGADIQEVAEIMGLDRRIGSEGLKAGLGCGGSPLFNDALSLFVLASQHDYDFELLQGTLVTDHQQTERILGSLLRRYDDLCGLTISVLGLTYKPNTDEVKNSRAMSIVRLLLAKGVHVRAYDPVAMEAAKAELGAEPNLHFAANAYEASRGADALLVLTDWPEFAHLDFRRLASEVRTPVLFDARCVVSLPAVRAAGFEAHGLGRLSARRMSPAFGQRLVRSKAFTR